MSWVYSIAFIDWRFVMVFNPKRDGWEMPGGRIENGEAPEEAAKREFLEESGCVFAPYACMRHRDGYVFTGDVGCPKASGEMRWQLFGNLPEQLAFGKAEYAEVLDWALEQRQTHLTK